MLPIVPDIANNWIDIIESVLSAKGFIFPRYHRQCKVCSSTLSRSPLLACIACYHESVSRVKSAHNFNWFSFFFCFRYDFNGFNEVTCNQQTINTLKIDYFLVRIESREECVCRPPFAVQSYCFVFFFSVQFPVRRIDAKAKFNRHINSNMNPLAQVASGQIDASCQQTAHTKMMRLAAPTMCWRRNPFHTYYLCRSRTLKLENNLPSPSRNPLIRIRMQIRSRNVSKICLLARTHRFRDIMIFSWVRGAPCSSTLTSIFLLLLFAIHVRD